MTKKELRQEPVQCPFYRQDDGFSRVHCEGIVEGSTIGLIFQRKKDFELQKRVFCCEHYRKCEIYGVLWRKYEE